MADQAVRRQGVFQQAAIPRLKNMQRLHHVRKQHQIRQWKQPHQPREILVDNDNSSKLDMASEINTRIRKHRNCRQGRREMPTP